MNIEALGLVKMFETGRWEGCVGNLLSGECWEGSALIHWQPFANANAFTVPHFGYLQYIAHFSFWFVLLRQYHSNDHRK
jgi:hypothetical protein